MRCQSWRNWPHYTGMNNVKKLEISDRFTLEDIRKIREHSYLRWQENPEVWRRERKEASAKMQAEIEKLREARCIGKIRNMK